MAGSKVTVSCDNEGVTTMSAAVVTEKGVHAEANALPVAFCRTQSV